VRLITSSIGSRDDTAAYALSEVRAAEEQHAHHSGRSLWYADVQTQSLSRVKSEAKARERGP